MNPLKQYFRRPAIYLTLPSRGKYYPEGALEMPPNGELPVYPMTALDELTSKTPDSLYNGSAVVEIIKSCVPAIKDPWSIPSTDLNAILIAIRTASTGNSMTIDTVCPKCEESNTHAINLAGLLSDIKEGDYTSPLKLGELAIKFKPLNFKLMNSTNLSQFDVQVQLAKLNQMTDEKEQLQLTSQTLKMINENLFGLVADSIESISLPNEIVTNHDFILEFVKNTDKKTFDMIKDHSANLRETSELKPFKLKCVGCSHEYNQNLTLNASDFFG
jgi:hypothetical protein